MSINDYPMLRAIANSKLEDEFEYQLSLIDSQIRLSSKRAGEIAAARMYDAYLSQREAFSGEIEVRYSKGDASYWLATHEEDDLSREETMVPVDAWLAARANVSTTHLMADVKLIQSGDYWAGAGPVASV